MNQWLSNSEALIRVGFFISVLIKLAVVVALGAPPLAVLIFEVLLNATAMFNHGNVRLPLWIDR